MIKKIRSLAPTPFLKHALTFLLIAGMIFIFIPLPYPSWFHPRLTGIGALIYSLVIISPRLLYPNRTTPEKNVVLTRVQHAFAAAILLGFSGTLGLFQLYRLGLPYDKLVHFLVPFMLTAATIEFAVIWYRRPLKYAIFIGVLLVLLAATQAEFNEYLGDIFLKTRAFGQGGQNLFADTLGDFIFNTLGISLAAALRYRHFRRLAVKEKVV